MNAATLVESLSAPTGNKLVKVTQQKSMLELDPKPKRTVITERFCCESFLFSNLHVGRMNAQLFVLFDVLLKLEFVPNEKRIALPKFYQFHYQGLREFQKKAFL